ncbi:hypothetical protein MMC06_002967 [Schaereria dolodes]|nr:hypothetical protein [Schaereria dolodes]
MSYQTRSLSSNIRHPSLGGSQASSGQSPVLLARIKEKKAELENLKQLQELSAGLAGQMSTLEQKLAMLSDGTEAVAMVLANWHNVLRAINMASIKMPKPKVEERDVGGQDSKKTDSEVPLPQTLIRIPVQQYSEPAMGKNLE